VEVGIIVVGYLGYALVRLAVRAGRPAAFAHAAELWRAERLMHLDIEPSLYHLAAAHAALAETAGYYYGLLHFIVTPLVLAWLWLRRPAAFGPLRSALVLATTGANVVFWTWPAAPPRFSVPGMTDVLVRYHILGSGDPHGPDGLVNLYAAMPSLHVAWAAWCAAAVVIATRGRWRHLAWLYPAATALVVLASANHFVLDAAGLAVMALGLLATRATSRPDATGPVPGGAGPAAASAAIGPGAATRGRRPVIWGRRLARRWAWPVTGAAAALIALRVPAASADVRAALAGGLRLPWLAAAAAAEAVLVAGLVGAQRQLLAAAGARLPARAVAMVVLASTGLARLLPAGPAAAAAWQAGQYRRRDPASSTAGLWAVLAGGVAFTVAVLVVLAAGAIAAARWWLLLGGAAPLAAVAAAAMAARQAGAAARWLARHAGRSRWRCRLATGLAGLARHRLGPRRGAAALAASTLSVLAEAGLLAAAFEVAGTPVPWRGLLLAYAAGQLGARLVPLPGGLGGMEGGVLGALALTGTHPATALTAVIVYRVAGYWAPGAAGAVTAALLTRHPASAARPVTPLRPQAPPPPAPQRPTSPRQAASGAPPAQPIAPAAGPGEGDRHVARPGEHAPAARAARRRPWRDYWQLVPVALLMYALVAVDRFRHGAQAAGLVNAVTINKLSRPIGGGAALAMNHWLIHHPVPAAAAAAYYMVLQVLVTAAAGIWLFGSGHPSFRLHRGAADARAARPWSAPGCRAGLGIKPASAHPRACPGGQTLQTAAGYAASARSSPDPGVTGPAVRHGCGPAPLPGLSRVSRRDGHRPLTETKKGTCHEHATHPPPGRQQRVRGGRPGRPVRRGRGGRVPAAGYPARHRCPVSRRARHADRAVGRHLAVVHHPPVRRRQRHRRQPDLRAGGRRRRCLRPGRPARVRRPAARQRTARRLADHRRAHPQPEAPHRRPDVLVQQLGRRGADRPARRQPGRYRAAVAGPPLTTRTASRHVLTPAQTRSSGACYEP